MGDATRLDGRVAVVTGGAGGIGHATGALLADRGARVVLTDRDRRVEEAARAIGPSASALEHDVTDPAASARVADAVLARHGRLDVWVNAAGWDRPGMCADSDPERWLEIVRINYGGVLAGGPAARRQPSELVLELADRAEHPGALVPAEAAPQAPGGAQERSTTDTAVL